MPPGSAAMPKVLNMPGPADMVGKWVTCVGGPANEQVTAWFEGLERLLVAGHNEEGHYVLSKGKHFALWEAATPTSSTEGEPSPS